ncbi:MAG TPA: isopentenyl-diphosphate Delta-isomerase [Euzebyales bacterium]|nr:isopentenyl-diphosphate Delta-isomerase [Euzebyales bacterium]
MDDARAGRAAGGRAVAERAPGGRAVAGPAPGGRAVAERDRTGDGTRVVVLDAAGGVAGAMDKLAAHVPPATPHLAFSVVLFDDAGATLLQRRAATKYHFAGRWSNSCCSHPRPGEPLVAAARRRVAEELNLRCDALEIRGAFWYQAFDPASRLAEHEYDVVLVGRVAQEVHPDPAEASAVALERPDAVLAAYRDDPAAYTPWLPQVLAIARGPAQPITVDVAR